jgi:hypothetical protein
MLWLRGEYNKRQSASSTGAFSATAQQKIRAPVFYVLL